MNITRVELLAHLLSNAYITRQDGHMYTNKKGETFWCMYLKTKEVKRYCPNGYIDSELQTELRKLLPHVSLKIDRNVGKKSRPGEAQKMFGKEFAIYLGLCTLGFIPGLVYLFTLIGGDLFIMTEKDD